MFSFKKKQANGVEASAFERVRYAGERDLLAKLFEQYSLASLIDHVLDAEQIGPFHQAIMAEQLRLTPLLAPRVFGVFEQVHGRLGFEEASDLFVYPEAKINAFALHRLRDDSSHVISITSDT